MRCISLFGKAVSYIKPSYLLAATAALGPGRLYNSISSLKFLYVNERLRTTVLTITLPFI